MAGATGNTTRLWALVGREFWRKARRRLRSGPVYHWRFSGRVPERVLIAPPDLRLADPQIALEIYYGRFPLSGHLVETGGQSPFQMPVSNRGWQKSLHGFRWLRHMRAAGTELAAANARALVSDWIAIHGATHFAGDGIGQSSDLQQTFGHGGYTFGRQGEPIDHGELQTFCACCVEIPGIGRQ